MKKIIMLALTMVLAMSFMYICYAEDEIPADLPVGTIKVSEGIYSYTPLFVPMNNSGTLTIPSIPPMYTFINPANFNNIKVDTGHTYLCVNSSKLIYINLLRGTQNVFGTVIEQWPQIGPDFNTTYYIETDYFNIQRNVAYQLQCTSGTSKTLTNTQLKIYSE